MAQWFLSRWQQGWASHLPVLTIPLDEEWCSHNPCNSAMITTSVGSVLIVATATRHRIHSLSE
jgi:hypothetical protein